MEPLPPNQADLHAESAAAKALQAQVEALQDKVATGATRLAAAEKAAAAADLRGTELSQQVRGWGLGAGGGVGLGGPQSLEARGQVEVRACGWEVGEGRRC